MKPRAEELPIFWLDKADSTNSELRKRLHELDNLSIIAAKSQIAGRGQGSHVWYSTSENLTFSILYKYKDSYSLKASDALLITEVTTLAIRDYLLSRGIKTRIKWPNDIWSEDKKICGILIDNILNGSLVTESIVGIGLNVNECDWPDYLPNPVSMTQLTGVKYDPKSELNSLYNDICRRFHYLGSAEGRKSLEEEFGEQMFRLDA